MARGSDNQPENPHLATLGDCKCTFYEQASHRDVSRSNPQGFKGGESHHIVSLAAMANRVPSNPAHAEYLEQCLWVTPWNINKAPNMIGLPTRAWYRKAYGASNYTPKNVPSHNNDHLAYINEVHDYLRDVIWDQLDPTEKDHKKSAKELLQALKDASEYFQTQLLDVRGIRNGGTVASWKNRFGNNTDKDARRASLGINNLWYQPFSMALAPKPRSPGQDKKDLTWLFSSDFWK